MPLANAPSDLTPDLTEPRSARTATLLSCRSLLAGSWPAGLPLRLLARAWLAWIGIAVFVPACLVMSTPDLSPPRQTAPYLVAATAVPDPREVLIIDLGDPEDKPGHDFNSHIVSEDAGQDVQYQLYTDYGYPNVYEQRPYREATPLFKTPAGSLTDKTRDLVQVTWYPKLFGPGCHNVTLIASHAFDPSNLCPVCPADASQITWQVYLCNKTAGLSCSDLDFSECQNWTKSCPLKAMPDAGASCTTE